ncbi:F-box/WD repeat-containing protein pof7 [Rhizoctonia solani]|uniref:F-box/WD repeat-containing protein pof7 n=1 Tax=Rhizoctonia solani TaxID=456999 RepID=A0A8H8NQV9_9AGAM|nr:F-box/WD repeat-containing protein pof7 [Rhizoctonia solani]QRW16806.1 F-box/WD repeat-containing protein pof7 [Rhizoctonia solani]
MAGNKKKKSGAARKKQAAAASATTTGATEEPIVIPDDEMESSSDTDTGPDQLDLAAQAEIIKERGNDQFRKGQYESAIESYSKAISMNPNEPSYLTNRAASYMALKKFSQALSDCQTAASLQSANPVPKTLLRLARFTLRSEMFPHDVRKRAEGLELHLKRFKDAKDKNEWGAARLALEQAVEAVEGDVPVQWRCWRVECEVARGSWTGAQNAVSDALRLAPNSSEVLTLRGLILFLTNQIPKAIQHAQQALRLDPDCTPARQLLRRAKEVERVKEEGNTFFKAGRLGEAVERYGEALELKQLEPALEDTNASLALNPDSYKALRTRARIHLELEHYEDAVRDFKAAQESAESDGAAGGEVRSIAEEVRKAEVLLKRSKTKDYYKILNVARDCSDPEIKKAYRRESLIHHPDKGGDEEKFKILTEAYTVLSDPQRRRRYDMGVDEDGESAGGGMGGMGDPMMGMQMNLAEMLAQMQGGGRGGFGGFSGFGGGGGFPGGGGGGFPGGDIRMGLDFRFPIFYSVIWLSNMATTAAPLASLNSLGSNTRSPSAGPSKYRGAVVEDLQLPPAFALSRSEHVVKAIELAYDRDFSYIPVLDSRRKPVGYINVADLKTKWEAGSANPSDLISNYMTKFARGTGVEYTVITPETPLEELEAFLETTDFAIVTDWNRKFVLGVATKDDLSMAAEHFVGEWAVVPPAPPSPPVSPGIHTPSSPNTVLVPVFSPPTPAPSPRPDSHKQHQAPISFNRDVLPYFYLLSPSQRREFVTQLIQACDVDQLVHANALIQPRLKRDFLRELPLEVSLYVLSLIGDAKTLARAAQVSRFWNALVADEWTWKVLCDQAGYGSPKSGPGMGPVPRYDELVRGMRRLSITTTAPGSGPSSDMPCYPFPASSIPRQLTHQYHYKLAYLTARNWLKGGRILRAHNSSDDGVVTSVAMDDEWIVVGLANHRIHVFSSRTGRLVRTLVGHTLGVWTLGLVSRGGVLKTAEGEEERTPEQVACDAQVTPGRFWEGVRQRTRRVEQTLFALLCSNCLHVLKGHTSTIRCLKVLDSRPIAVSGSRDTTVRVWDIARAGKFMFSRDIQIRSDAWRLQANWPCGMLIPENVYEFRGHYHEVYSVAFDGELLATGSLDSHVRIWSASTGDCIALLQGHTSLVGQIQLLGNILVTGGSDGRVIVYDTATLETVHRISAHDNSVTCLQFDERYMVSGGSDGSVKMYDMKTGQFVREMTTPCEAVWRVSFRDDKCVMMCRRSGRTVMEIWTFRPTDEEM